MTFPETVAKPRRLTRMLILYGVVLAIGIAGLEIKRPFGLFLFHLMGKQTGASPHTTIEWLMTDPVTISVMVIACFFHPRSGLPLIPRLERLLFRDARTGPPPRVFKPGFLGGFVSVGVFVVSQCYQLITHTQMPLASKLSSGAIPRSALIKLALLFPLAFVGAAMSEEVACRFGLMSILMGLMSFAAPRGRSPNNAVAFWIANIAQGLWFGYIHVAQGVVASQGGSLPYELATSPQTWGGIIFGVVYRKFGLEAAIIAHMTADILAPIVLGLWNHFLH